MNILFFDTETTGKPKNYKAPMFDVNNWPRLVQLGVIEHRPSTNEVLKWELLVKPNGFEIPAEVVAVHGITTEKAMQEGENLEYVLEEFRLAVDMCDVIVGHNIEFDINVVGAESIRCGGTNLFAGKTVIDTMKSSTEFCAIPGPYGFKWPKLTELWFKLFGTELPQTHTALDDIKNTATCFFELEKRGIISLPQVQGE